MQDPLNKKDWRTHRPHWNDWFSDKDTEQDILGEATNYSWTFADLRARGGQFYTPRSIVNPGRNVEPTRGHIDPCCGLRMFVRAKNSSKRMAEELGYFIFVRRQITTWVCEIIFELAF